MSDTHNGRCECGRLTFAMIGHPIVVNACHCRDCQRLSGSAFALNGMIEADRVREDAPIEPRDLSGALGERSWRCATCGVLLWGEHRLFGERLKFVRLGTLERSEAFAPDAHFFVRSKHPWITLPDGVPAYETLPEGAFEPQLDAERRARLAAVTGAGN